MTATIFFDEVELATLRQRSRSGPGARIWRNLVATAHPWVGRAPRAMGIDPRDEDPDHENLYDRFYAIMSDAAIAEHVAFAAAVGGAADLRRAAEQRLVALCRAWTSEAARPPDHGSAYATTRLLRAAAITLDLTEPWIAPETRTTAIEFVSRLGGVLWEGWFRLPVSTGPDAHTHHAHVEWGSLGAAALAMRERLPETRPWLDATVRKFELDLLPRGLAPDGAQVEGASFWASTMTTRLAFIDALRRHTGTDLSARHAERMSADVSIAAIAAPTDRGPAHESRQVLMEPAYAQLAYHAPALLGLARLHRRPHLRYLAHWDRSLGALQETGTWTPNRERLRFALGHLALLWDDPTLALAPAEPRRSFSFPSVGQAYVRDDWRPGGIVVGVDGGRVVIHAGGRVVLADLTPAHVVDRPASEEKGTGVYRWYPEDLVLEIQTVEDDGRRARVVAANADSGARLEVTLERPGDLWLRREGDAPRLWWCAPGVRRTRDGLAWGGPGGPRMEVVRGHITHIEDQGHRDEHRVGYGNLRLVPADDDRRPLIHVEPDDPGVLALRIVTTRSADRLG